MRTNATGKLLEGVTGKEAYQLVTRTYLERRQGKEPAFSDADLDKMISSLSSRPDERRDYYHWCQSHPVIDTLQSELRVAAMNGVWRLSVLASLISNHMRRKPVFDDKGKALLAELPSFQAAAQLIHAIISEVATFNLMLEAFGEVLGCDLLILTRKECELLRVHIDLYNRMAEYLEDDLMYAEYCQGKDIDNREPVILRLAFAVPGDAAAIKRRFVEAVEDAYHGSFWDITGVLEEAASSNTATLPAVPGTY